jgi:SNF2 family DNA or RNA helicase
MRPYQGATVRRMVKGTIFVGAEQGLGKSRMVCEAVCAIGLKRVLVAAPAIGRVSWPIEVAKWHDGARVVVALKPADVAKAVPRDGEVVYLVVSYDALSRSPQAWLQGLRTWGADVVVLDEAHALKTRSARRTKVVYGARCDRKNSLVEKARYVWPLSGTPAPNHVGELWTHLHALMPGLIWNNVHKRPLTEVEFQDRFCTVRETPFGRQITGSKNVPELREATQSFFVRIRKADVLKELQPITWTTEPIAATLPAAALDVPDSIADDDILDFLNKNSANVAAGRRMLGLAKINGAVEWAENFLDSSTNKLVLFGWHKDVVSALAEKLRRFGSVLIDGSTAPDARTIAVNTFQNDPNTRVFVGQMLAAGTAITLTASSDVAFVEGDWTPGTIAQAAARTHRLGQRDGVIARLLYVPGSLDERISRVLARKARDVAEMFDQPSQTAGQETAA